MMQLPSRPVCGGRSAEMPCTGSEPYHFVGSFPGAGCVSLGPVGIPALRPYRGIRIAASVRGGSIQPISRAPN